MSTNDRDDQAAARSADDLVDPDTVGPGTAAHNRRRLERIAAAPDNTAVGRFQRQMLGLMEEFAREQAAARAKAGDPDPYDLAPFADVRDLADGYASTEGEPEARDLFLDSLADDLDLDDVRAIRTAAEAVAAAMGRIALAHREQGMSPDRIAQATGYTASRVGQFIREERDRRAGQ